MPTLKIAKESPQHERLVTMLVERIKFAEKAANNREGAYQKAEEEIIAYVPESEADALRRSRRENEGIPTYTTLKVPYTYAMLMSAHTYWTSVFFARNPVHQYSGLHGEGERQTQALEALVSYQVDVGEMLAPYYIWLYDAGKYGEGIFGTYWDQEIIQVGEVVPEIDPVSGKPSGRMLQTTTELEGYEGNRGYNVAPYDFLTDPRQPRNQFQKGEFVAVRRRIPWNEIVRRQARGFYMNLEHIRPSQPGQFPQRGSGQLEKPEEVTDFENLNGVKHPAKVDAYEIYVDLIPQEWGLGRLTFPQKWVFTLTADLALLIGVQPLGLWHNKFPFDLLECEIEGYALHNRGIPEIIEMVQRTMDWLLNVHFFNVRAALNNQFIIDPSGVVMKDTESGGPGFIYRLRPEAFGQDVRKFFMQVPVNDITRTNVQDMQTMYGVGERTLGINDQIMGMLTGGRKTATEVRTSTSFGVNRLKTISEYMSATGFSQHSRKLVQNSQQFYSAEKKFRIVGELAQEAGDPFMQVTPDLIAGSYSFIPVDGTLPVDRFQQATLWKELLAGIQNYPQVLQRYDIGRIFAWVMQLAGVKNLSQFKIEVGDPGQLAQQAQMGNLVPVPGGRPRPNGKAAAMSSPSAPTMAGLNAMGSS
jgi:hypothetical protein